MVEKSKSDCSVAEGKFCRMGPNRDKLDCIVCILNDIEKHLYDIKKVSVGKKTGRK